MVTLDRGLEEAAALLFLVAHGEEVEESLARITLAIMAVERARELLSARREILRREDW